MSNPLLPGPPAEASGTRSRQEPPRADDPQSQAADSARSDKPRFASEEQCLSALSGLPGMVALGILTPAKANSIRATYMAILAHHRAQRGNEERPGVADEAVVEALVRHPELANLFEPMLSREQIAAILARAK